MGQLGGHLREELPEAGLRLARHHRVRTGDRGVAASPGVGDAHSNSSPGASTKSPPSVPGIVAGTPYCADSSVVAPAPVTRSSGAGAEGREAPDDGKAWRPCDPLDPDCSSGPLDPDWLSAPLRTSRPVANPSTAQPTRNVPGRRRAKRSTSLTRPSNPLLRTCSAIVVRRSVA